MSEELNTITEPIKEANWMNLVRTFKLASTTALAVMLLGAGYWGGEYLTNRQHRYTKYIDGASIELAKDMQAICDQRKVCNKSEIIAKFNSMKAESLMLDMVEDYGGKK